MTRIVAGAAKGRRLGVPAHGTRPTSDRAREGLFNSLRALVDLDGASVLDLFAGTGAVGLEALSRGAAVVTLVESDRRAVAVLNSNVATVGLPGAQVAARTVESFLAGEHGQGYDIVFADPPYAVGDEALAGILAALTERGWLGADGVAVLERSVRSGPVPWPDVIEPISQRRYGDTMLWYGRHR